MRGGAPKRPVVVATERLPDPEPPEPPALETVPTIAGVPIKKLVPPAPAARTKRSMEARMDRLERYLIARRRIATKFLVENGDEPPETPNAKYKTKNDLYTAERHAQAEAEIANIIEEIWRDHGAR